MSGWICLHRGWRDCEAFEDSDAPMSEQDAWVWLIENAAWKDTRRRNAKGERIEVKRGQFHTSLRTLGDTFGWGKNKVARYLEKLVRYDMIGTVSGQSGVLITICNYAKYQDVEKPEGVVLGTVAGQSRDTQEQGKQDSASNEAGVPPVNIAKAIFDLGVELLTASGHNERAARSIVGRWRKSGDGLVMQALLDAQSRNITNIVEWMPKRLQGLQGSGSELANLLGQADRYKRQAA